MKQTEFSDLPVLTEEEVKARGKRNMALALGIVAFMCLVFGITLVRMMEGAKSQAETAAAAEAASAAGPETIEDVQ